MRYKKVSLVKGNDRKENIIKALELIKSDIRIKSKSRILIKPNLTATSNRYANTDVRAVEAIIEFLNSNFNKKEIKIVVGEASGSAFYEGKKTREVFKNFGYYSLEKKHKNVKIECFDESSEFFSVPIKTISGNSEVDVVRRADYFDYIISVNMPKTHNYAVATFGIKNMLGLIKQEDKSRIHGLRGSKGPDAKKTIFDIIPTSLISFLRRTSPGLVSLFFSKSATYAKSVRIIHQNIANVTKRIFPDMVVLDCFYGMEGNGPIDGKPVNLKAAIASTDALKADGTAARIMGLKPEEIGYLYYLKKQRLGDYSLNGLVGGSISDIAVKFRLHQTYKIQKEWK